VIAIVPIAMAAGCASRWMFVSIALGRARSLLRCFKFRPVPGEFVVRRLGGDGCRPRRRICGNPIGASSVSPLRRLLSSRSRPGPLGVALSSRLSGPPVTMFVPSGTAHRQVGRRHWNGNRVARIRL